MIFREPKTIIKMRISSGDVCIAPTSIVKTETKIATIVAAKSAINCRVLFVGLARERVPTMNL
jgi:hypothetical protein